MLIDFKHPPILEIDPRSHRIADIELPVCVVGGGMGVEICILCLFISAVKLRCYSGTVHFGFQDSHQPAVCWWCWSFRQLSPSALSTSVFLILGLQSCAMGQAFQDGFWWSVSDLHDCKAKTLPTDLSPQSSRLNLLESPCYGCFRCQKLHLL